MSYTSPLGRLPRKRTHPEARQAIIPEQIRLPDGSQVAIRDIVNRSTNRQNHNLLTRQTVSIKPRGTRTKLLKYTIEERIWLRRAEVEEIARRYNYTLKKAQSVKYTSRYVVNKLEL